MSINLPSPRKKTKLTSPIHICRSTVIPRRRELGHSGIMYMTEVRRRTHRRPLSPPTQIQTVKKKKKKKKKSGSELKRIGAIVKRTAPTLISLIYTTITHTHTIYQQPTKSTQDTKEAHDNCLSISINHFILV